MPRKRLIQLDDLFRLKAVGRVALSPDGARAVYELKRFDIKENRNFQQLMVADVATGKSRALTRGAQTDSRPQWSPDGASLAFISDRAKAATLWVLPMDGGEPERLTEPDGFVHDFAWHPKGRKIAYTWQAMNERQKLERDGKTRELRRGPLFKHITRLFHKLDGAGWWNGERTHLWIVGAAGGKPRRIGGGDHDYAEPRYSPDGRTITFVSNHMDNPDIHLENSDIFAMPEGGGRVRQLTRGIGSASGHSWSPDGSQIAFIGNPGKTGQQYRYNHHVWVVPAAGGRPRDVTRELDNACFNVTLADVAGAAFDAHAPLWSMDGKRVYFLVSEGGAVRLYSRSLHKADLRCEVDGPINMLYANRAGRRGTFAVSMGTQVNPSDVYAFDPAAKGGLRRLTHVNEAVLGKIELATPQPFKVRSGRTTVHGWVIRPPGVRATKKCPAILEIHGGPHAQYGHSFMHEMQLLAAKGYVVAFANPRGSAGYGLKHTYAIWQDWGNLDYKDCMRVTDWLASRPYVDRNRLGVTGGSYGGYMTNWLIGHTNRYKAAVTQRSVVNFESMYGTSDVGWDFEHEMGGSPWTARQKMWDQSPLKFARKISTPLLIEHEEEDHRCPISEAEQLFTALKTMGAVVEMVRFEGESHGLSRGGRPANRAERLRRIVGWFDKYLKP